MTHVILADELEEIKAAAQMEPPTLEKFTILQLCDYIDHLQDQVDSLRHQTDELENQLDIQFYDLGDGK